MITLFLFMQYFSLSVRQLLNNTIKILTTNRVEIRIIQNPFRNL